MKKSIPLLVAAILLFTTTACNLTLLGATTPTPTLLLLPSPTPLIVTPVVSTPSPTFTLSLPSPTVIVPTSIPTFTPSSTPNPTLVLPSPTATPSGPVIIPGSPSGPYAVIQVASSDTLKVHSAPGVGNPVVGSFTAIATNVTRIGPSAIVAGDLWVQVNMPGGGLGWVNAAYLTEYVAPATFCADTHVSTLLTTFANAVITSNGVALMGLVSPAHGMAVRLWRNGNVVIFYPKDAHWMFGTTYEHDWGAAPGSGLETIGAFHVIVLPKWLDVFNAPAPGFTSNCNTVQTGGASYDTSWPAIYANVNFYSLYKAGPVGNENSWRTLLVGVEYVNGQPYIFSVTQMNWEP